MTIHRATNLGGDYRDQSEINSYIKLYLLPDKKQKQQTKVIRVTKDPCFEEMFSFAGLPLSELGRHKLSFKVLNSQLIKKDELLGESAIFLSSLKPNEKEVFNLDLVTKRSKVRF